MLKHVFFTITILVFILSAPFLAHSASIEGRALVIDGDTIAVEGTDERIRLYGIDTPEGKQSCVNSKGDQYLCGSKAAEELANLIGRNGQVTCVEEDRDRYGRIVGSCYRDELYLNEEMVRLGWATEYTKYSDGRFSNAQMKAQSALRGLWAGSFVKPWEWRRGKRLEDVTVADRKSTNCNIKGNISSNGRIYHLPNQQHYDRTKINLSKNERWFCTEQEAKNAGWRRAKR